MTITIRINPNAFGAGQVLAAFATTANAPYARPLQYPDVPRPVGQSNKSFIATASPLTARSNIREDGTFPDAPASTRDAKPITIIHISPTSGSTVLRADPFKKFRAEYDPSYGLNVGMSPVELEDTVFETALEESSGSAFKANLQELISLGVIIVEQNGTELTAIDIRDFTASTS